MKVRALRFMAGRSQDSHQISISQGEAPLSSVRLRVFETFVDTSCLDLERFPENV